MNELLFLQFLRTCKQLYVSVATVRAAVTVPLCQSTLSCYVRKEDTESQSLWKGLFCPNCKCM